MYNPEKQARAAGGRFGGKKVTTTEVIGMARGGPQFVDLDDEFDGFEIVDEQAKGKANVAVWLFVAALAIVVIGLLTACHK